MGSEGFEPPTVGCSKIAGADNFAIETTIPIRNLISLILKYFAFGEKPLPVKFINSFFLTLAW